MIIRLIAGAVLTALVVTPRAVFGAAQPASAAPQASPLVVVTFTNVGGDPDDDWIGTGIAEALATTLGNGVRAPSVAAAEQRGATRIIEGTYERIGTRVRITALLTDLETDRVVRPALVDGELTHLFALQDDLAAQLAGAPAVGRVLGDAVHRARPAHRPSPSGEALTGRAGFALGSGITIDGPPPPPPPAMVARDARGRATMRATRVREPISLDGRLDEGVYQSVEAVGGFIQQEPDEGAPATEATESWIFYDDDTLYVAARCWDSQPERMVANEMRRDNLGIFQNENFAVVLDTFYDRRNGYMFHTNPLGGMFDGHITDEGNMNRDWNGVWDVRTARFAQGWTVEMAISFKSLRFRPGAAQTWGVNLRRIVRWKNETSYLTAVPASRGLSGIMQLSVAGTLVDVEAPSRTGNIEVKPYVISDLTTDRLASPPTTNEFDGDVGVDVKYGVTQSLTADVTYNTDFAQVEVDEQQVNLTRFSLFFPEKREFFLEGQGIFDFGGGRGFSGRGFGLRVGGSGGGGSNTPILFFSRRIGLEEGRPVPIEVGGRLTGKVGPFSVGVLDIRTGGEPVSGARSTNFAVVRIKRDILRRSSIGAMVTHRSVALASDGSNQAYGMDGTFGFYDNVNLNTYLARTETPGLDSGDLSYRGQFDYNGDRYGLQVERLVVDEHFNPEVGFLRRTDFQRSFASARFSPRPRGIASVRKLSWEGNFDYISNGDGRIETRIATGAFGIELENSDQFLAQASQSYEFLDEPFDIATDVTIPVGGYSFADTRVSYSFGSQRPFSGAVSASHGRFFGGDKTTVELSRGRVGLASRLSVEPAVSVNWVDVPAGAFTTTLVGTRTTFTVSPRAFVSALLQYNSAAESLSTNVRLRWEYQPGSELFVVYTDQRDTLVPRFPELENRAFVIKLNRLFRF
ncbi:MAG: DUF5916 domain-containing protein [Vicinamibacterales bacterium]|nr:DUF5916 domain-containing protein [Vicinamibacterales bacterium]